jgi:hypothetical protein
MPSPSHHMLELRITCWNYLLLQWTSRVVFQIDEWHTAVMMRLVRGNTNGNSCQSDAHTLRNDCRFVFIHNLMTTLEPCSGDPDSKPLVDNSKCNKHHQLATRPSG